VLIVLALAAAVPGGLLIALALNLPALDDAIISPDVAAPLSIRRDAHGILTVDASSPTDAAWALGYAHAQDRLFQMDLMRRTAAGELSELLGYRTVDADIATRRWQLRSLASEQLASAREDLALTVRAYTAGVNAGIDSLKLRPLEYILLRSGPRRWQEEDCLLVIHAMFLMLTDPSASREHFLAELKNSVSPEIFKLLTLSEGDWDSSFIENVAAQDVPAIPAAQPGLSANHLRGRSGALLPQLQQVFPGSSSWAVSGRRTGHP
jgi:penicillin amidase